MQYAELTWDANQEEREVFLQHLAPVVIFTYNRLSHTKQTIEALQKNMYAEYTSVFVFSDGPKDNGAIDKVKNVRDYLYTVTGFKSIEIIERHENWGLAKNIIHGITAIMKKYGRAIILEDDIVTSRGFLKYMNDALTVYQDVDMVKAISGYYCSDAVDDLPETFFLIPFDCWGWATWERAWKDFERDPEGLVNKFSKEEIYRFNIDISGKGSFWSQVEGNYNGKIYTWAIFFYAMVFMQNGLVLYSKYNFSKNIGCDGSGEHCDEDDTYPNRLDRCYVEKFTTILCENKIARARMSHLYKAFEAGIIRRIGAKGKHILKRIFLFEKDD